jgi:Tfp pilus assembly protein PilZ
MEARRRETSMGERAEHPKTDPRLAVRMRVKVSTVDPETDPWTGKSFFLSLEETCANVSRGGAFVVTEETIAPGRKLLLELEVPGGERLQTFGRVAWTRARLSPGSPAGEEAESGIGIEFLASRRDQLVRLDRFLSRSQRRRKLASEATTAGSGPSI